MGLPTGTPYIGSGGAGLSSGLGSGRVRAGSDARGSDNLRRIMELEKQLADAKREVAQDRKIIEDLAVRLVTVFSISFSNAFLSTSFGVTDTFRNLESTQFGCERIAGKGPRTRRSSRISRSSEREDRQNDRAYSHHNKAIPSSRTAGQDRSTSYVTQNSSRTFTCSARKCNTNRNNDSNTNVNLPRRAFGGIGSHTSTCSCHEEARTWSTAIRLFDVILRK
jgi:hypothetical protein